MNIFREHLERLVHNLPHALSACIIGIDGIALEQCGEETTQLFVEYEALVKEFRTTTQMFAAGELEEFTARTDRYTCLVRPINREFLMMLVLLPQACVGKGRFLLRLIAPQLEPRLS